MDVNLANPVHLKVLQELRSYGITIATDLLKNEKKKFAKILTPRKVESWKTNKPNPNSTLFGIELSLLPTVFTSEFGMVPQFLYESIKLLEGHMETKGLFRLNGSEARIRDLQKRFENDKVNECKHPVDLATLTKRFFRDLPEPLITKKVYNVLRACKEQIDEPHLQTKAIIRSVHLLPDNNIAVFRFLSDFLTRLSSIPENMMDTLNLASIWAPTLLHPESISNGGEGFRGHMKTTRFIEVDIIKTLLDNWKFIGKSTATKVDNWEDMRVPYTYEVDEGESLQGFGSNLSPIRARKRIRECSQRVNVTFNVKETLEDEFGWAGVTQKIIKMDDTQDTTTIRKKKLLKLFRKKSKSNKLHSATLPSESLQHTALGETTSQTKIPKQLWRKILDRIKKPKNKNKVPLKGFLNVTSVGPSYLKENFDPEFSYIKERNHSNYIQNQSCVTDRTSRGYNIGDCYTTPDFKKCPITLNVAGGDDKSHKVENQFLNRCSNHGFTFMVSREHQLNMEDAVLNDEDYDEENDLNRAKIDYDDSLEVSNLSEALVKGSYCGKQSNQQKPTEPEFPVVEVKKNIPCPTTDLPKISLKSLDSGLSISPIEDIAPKMAERSRFSYYERRRQGEPRDANKFLKSPLALPYKSRKALVFENLRSFDGNF